MPGDYDHIQAFVNRLRLKRQALDQEARKLDETIRAIEEGLGSLTTKDELQAFLDERSVERTKAKATREGVRIQNRNVTELVREYVAKLQPTGATSFEGLKSAAIDMRKLVEFLWSNGCKGDYRSLYSSVHVALRKEADKHGTVRYMKGVGFYKPAEQSGAELRV